MLIHAQKNQLSSLAEIFHNVFRLPLTTKKRKLFQENIGVLRRYIQSKNRRQDIAVKNYKLISNLLFFVKTLYPNSVIMNKYVLIPRGQYDKFKEFLLSESNQINHKEETMQQETSPQKDSIDRSIDKDNQVKAMSKDQIDDNIKSDSSESLLKPVHKGKIPPPPGIPETESVSAFFKNNNNKVRDKKKQEGYGERPEWFKYWNKNVR